MKKLLFSFFVLFLITAKPSYSQSDSNKSNISGFVVLESKVNLSEYDLGKLNTENFDKYRYYNLRKKIQLVRGPLIELLSAKELENSGVVFAADVLDLIKSKDESFKHELISTVNIGLGVSSINKGE
jgi:hypothetical protein